MAFEIPGFKLGTQTAAGTLTAGRFVAVNTTGGIAQVGTAGATAAGVTETDAASGEAVPVIVGGVAKVVAGAAVATTGEVTSDNQGRAISAATTGHSINGIALETAGAAGEVIAVLVGYKGAVPA